MSAEQNPELLPNALLPHQTLGEVPEELEAISISKSEVVEVRRMKGRYISRSVAQSSADAISGGLIRSEEGRLFSPNDARRGESIAQRIGQSLHDQSTSTYGHEERRFILATEGVIITSVNVPTLESMLPDTDRNQITDSSARKHETASKYNRATGINSATIFVGGFPLPHLLQGTRIQDNVNWSVQMVQNQVQRSVAVTDLEQKKAIGMQEADGSVLIPVRTNGKNKYTSNFVRISPAVVTVDGNPNNAQDAFEVSLVEKTTLAVDMNKNGGPALIKITKGSDAVKVGRGTDKNPDVVFSDQYGGVSREHAYILYGADRCEVADLGSMYGTYVDGAPLPKKLDSTRTVQDGSVVTFGNVHYLAIMAQEEGEDFLYLQMLGRKVDRDVVTSALNSLGWDVRDTDRIIDAMRSAEYVMDTLSQLNETREDLETKSTEYDQMVTRYNNLVEPYNTLVNEHRTLNRQLGQIIAVVTKGRWGAMDDVKRILGLKK